MNIYSAKYDEFIENVHSRTEKDLQNFLVDKWDRFFPHLEFIKSEFEIKGEVKSETGRGGFVDILAFNHTTNCFVIIELKRKSDGGIKVKSQVQDYADAFLLYMKNIRFFRKYFKIYRIISVYTK